MANLHIATCQAPVNIAVVKYWGKRDEKLMLPVNDSISVTLSTDDLCTTTSIAASQLFKEDKLVLNGKVCLPRVIFPIQCCQLLRFVYTV